MNVIVSVVIRHFLAAVGVSGIVSDDQLKQIVGALVTLAMVGWSLYQKRDQISAKSYITKSNGQTIDAAHINDLRLEVTAVEADLIAGRTKSFTKKSKPKK